MNSGTCSCTKKMYLVLLLLFLNCMKKHNYRLYLLLTCSHFSLLHVSLSRSVVFSKTQPSSQPPPNSNEKRGYPQVFMASLDLFRYWNHLCAASVYQCSDSHVRLLSVFSHCIVFFSLTSAAWQCNNKTVAKHIWIYLSPNFNKSVGACVQMSK